MTTTKVDKEYPDNKLSGAVFEIYKDVDGNGEWGVEIDTLVGEMTETEAGVYLYEKLRYGGYFQQHPDTLVYKAKAEKYAKIISKTIILSGMDAASFGQNAYFYDAAEGLL